MLSADCDAAGRSRSRSRQAMLAFHVRCQPVHVALIAWCLAVQACLGVLPALLPEPGNSRVEALQWLVTLISVAVMCPSIVAGVVGAIFAAPARTMATGLLLASASFATLAVVAFDGRRLDLIGEWLALGLFVTLCVVAAAGWPASRLDPMRRIDGWVSRWISAFARRGRRRRHAAPPPPSTGHFPPPAGACSLGAKTAKTPPGSTPPPR